MRTSTTLTTSILLAVAVATGPDLLALGAGADPSGAEPATALATAETAPPTPRPPAAPPAPAPPAPPAPAPLAPAPPVDRRDAPDPAVLDTGHGWVLFSTQVGFLNVPAATSPDLATWSAPFDALPVLPAWAEWGSTWAPGAFERPGGGYALFFAARSRAIGVQCIGVATSPTPTGPFVSAGQQPLVCQPELGGAIDPAPFVDVDGTPYLVWKADGNAIGIQSTLFAQRLDPGGTALVGEPVALLRSGAAWERPLIENPALAVSGGRYVLLYSGGWWESAGYATGYAVCAGPLGPCTKVTEAASAHDGEDGEAGPGGATVLTGPAGDQWIAYHAWDAGNVGYDAGGARSLRFAPLGWDGAAIAIGR
jgi:beta-xylosidase